MNELQERILKSMDLTRQLSEEEIHEAIDLRMKEEIRKTPLDLLSREKLHRNIFYEIRQLGILQSLIENPEITEIMVNGTSGIFIETKRGAAAHAVHILKTQNSVQLRETAERVLNSML